MTKIQWFLWLVGFLFSIIMLMLSITVNNNTASYLSLIAYLSSVTFAAKVEEL